MPMTDNASAPRLLHVDALRGLIMAIMALDHARAFVARAHPFETWSKPLPQYDAVLPFAMRLVTHLCAPGFFFLMGVSMVLLANARRAGGWSEGRVVRFFVTRGLLLVAVEQFIENPAWMLGMLGAAHDPAIEQSFAAAEKVTPIFVFGVLNALGVAMVFWAGLLRLSSWLLVAIGVVAVGLTQMLTPPLADAAVPYSPLLRLLLIPGQTGLWFVLYPLIPWLGLTGFGIAFGRRLARAERTGYGLGAACLAAFVMVRMAGGFGNIHVPVPDGWIGFLNVTKYPPSLAFDLLTLGVNLILLAGLELLVRTESACNRPLLTFGRATLFFYIVHLYLYALIGFGFPHGAALPTVFPMWLLGLVVMYPLCRRWELFKRGKPVDSLWRFF